MQASQLRYVIKFVADMDAVEATLHYIAGNMTQGGKVSGIAQRLLGMADDTRSGIIATLSEQASFRPAGILAKDRSSVPNADGIIAEDKLPAGPAGPSDCCA